MPDFRSDPTGASFLSADTPSHLNVSKYSAEIPAWSGRVDVTDIPIMEVVSVWSVLSMRMRPDRLMRQGNSVVPGTEPFFEN